ncbi:cupin domain-containing protein [Ramlibacter alkalitolerans]|uniref:Cupin domain-containing protein n=2 Tax=Ramlibacter alkalitolerans TaxID=2039631 RepID=A0ABS1JS28_9BURK|nr:cupin domain-containing protein [Ramlibacter alkalitolerans]MBL0427075.1 cupin domain-containing protein [Ramlibacter alkalitolerans]
MNIADAPYTDLAERARSRGSALPQERFGGRIAPLGPALGARHLGFNVTVVAPGKRAFPFHSHRLNEEMFFVIEGTGQLRFGSATYPLRAGDVVACPPGGAEVAHQIVNTGATELKVLAVSTMQRPEVCHYPDSGKFAVLDGTAPEGFRHVARQQDSLDYWQGE